MDCKWLAGVAVASVLVPACALADDAQIQQVQTVADQAADQYLIHEGAYSRSTALGGEAILTRTFPRSLRSSSLR